MGSEHSKRRNPCQVSSYTHWDAPCTHHDPGWHLPCRAIIGHHSSKAMSRYSFIIGCHVPAASAKLLSISLTAAHFASRAISSHRLPWTIQLVPSLLASIACALIT